MILFISGLRSPYPLASFQKKSPEMLNCAGLHQELPKEKGSLLSALPEMKDPTEAENRFGVSGLRSRDP